MAEILRFGGFGACECISSVIGKILHGGKFVDGYEFWEGV